MLKRFLHLQILRRCSFDAADGGWLATIKVSSSWVQLCCSVIKLRSCFPR